MTGFCFHCTQTLAEESPWQRRCPLAPSFIVVDVMTIAWFDLCRRKYINYGSAARSGPVTTGTPVL